MEPLLPVVATMVTHIYIGFSIFPVLFSLLPSYYFCDYLPNKLPPPNFLSCVLLFRENQLRQQLLGKLFFRACTHW